MLARGGQGEETLVVECDLGLIDGENALAVLRDRRVDAYQEISKRYID